MNLKCFCCEFLLCMGELLLLWFFLNKFKSNSVIWCSDLFTFSVKHWSAQIKLQCKPTAAKAYITTPKASPICFDVLIYKPQYARMTVGFCLFFFFFFFKKSNEIGWWVVCDPVKFEIGPQTKDKHPLIFSLDCSEQLYFEAALFQHGLPCVLNWAYEQERKSFT